jgi:predicted nucleic acid-binding protein
MATITLSTNTLDQRSILTYPFQQASIYTDACFILSLMDTRDTHHTFSNNLLLLWAHSGATMCYSNHVQHEVTHALLKMYILDALSHYETLGLPTTTAGLTALDMDILIDLPLVISVHREAKAFTRSTGRYLPRNSRGFIKLVVPIFVKHLKKNGINITKFYTKANNVFDQFISRITTSIYPWYNLKLSCLLSTEQMGLNALQLAKDCDLDSTDAIHLCVAFHTGCNYFVTKDSDLSSINVNGIPQHTKLMKLATGTSGVVGTAPSPITGQLIYLVV